MAILTTFITSIVEMLILAGVSYGGIRLGKVLRDRKDAKMQAEIQPEKTDLDHTGGFVVKAYGVNELRKMFLEFFESKGHLAMKSIFHWFRTMITVF